MALLHGQASLSMLSVGRRLGIGTVTLGLAVTAWWFLIVAVIAFTVPTPAMPASTSPPTIVEGDVATIQAPPLAAWPIPSDRTTYDDYHRAFLDDDEGAMMEALSRPGWIPVADRQAVRLVIVDGGAAQVEVLDGPYAGSRGWLKARQLRP